MQNNDISSVHQWRLSAATPPTRKLGYSHCLQLQCHNSGLLGPPKAPSIHDRCDRIVCGIPCRSCNKVYIGGTGRRQAVRERILEHNRDVRLMWIDNLAIAEHMHDADHLPSWSGVQCLVHDRHWSTRLVREAIQI